MHLTHDEMGPGEIVSVDHTTMEAIWTAEGSETRAPLAEGPQGFAIAAFGKRTYRSEVPNLMLQVVAHPSMASQAAGAGAPKASQRKQLVLKKPAALKRPASARSKSAPAPHNAGQVEDCAIFF